VATQLNSLNAKTDALDEQYLEAQGQAADLKAKLADKQSAVAKAKSDMSADQKAARDYAVQAYVGGGDVDPVLLPSTDTADASHRTTYLTSLQGDREQVIDNLRASEQQLGDEQQSLNAAKTKLDQQLAGMDATRASLRSATTQAQSLQSSVDGKLKAAVAAEQARIAAAQQAAAEKAAQQAAARAAAEAARPAATVPHSSTTAGSSSHDSTGGSTKAAAPKVLPVVGPVTPAAAKAIQEAESQLGVAYHWAESDPGSGFDCSGLVMWAYGQAGISLPHSSRGMWAMTQRISADQLQPGDLVFGGSPVHHVGIYVGNGEMINAPHTGANVGYASIYTVNPASFGRI
jgi:cell wall-associated NlpC family hydrolase